MQAIRSTMVPCRRQNDGGPDFYSGLALTATLGPCRWRGCRLGPARRMTNGGKKGIASIGECMLELSGADAGVWRMGFAGDTSQHAVGAARAHRASSPPTMSRPSATTRSRATRSRSFPRTASALRRARSLRARGPASTRSRWPARNGRSPTGAATRQRGGWPTIRPHWRKALKTRHLSTFPESPWQFWSRRRGRRCSTALAARRDSRQR